MSQQNEDKLAKLLTEGWVITGYSSNVLAAGAITHSILLKKDSGLVGVTIIITGDKEVGRTFTTLSPAPPPKTGWL